MEATEVAGVVDRPNKSGASGDDGSAAVAARSSVHPCRVPMPTPPTSSPHPPSTARSPAERRANFTESGIVDAVGTEAATLSVVVVVESVDDGTVRGDDGQSMLMVERTTVEARIQADVKLLKFTVFGRSPKHLYLEALL